MKRTIITIVLAVLLLLMPAAVVLGFSPPSVTQTITQEIILPGEEPEPEEPEPEEPVLVRDPNQFSVFVRFGYDYTWYYSSDNNTLRGSIEAAGIYNGTQYMLKIPADSKVEGGTERVSWLWLADIDDNVLTFPGRDVEFSEPCTLYIAISGQISRYYWTREWIGEGEWLEVGTFTSIVDGQAYLE